MILNLNPHSSARGSAADEPHLALPSENAKMHNSIHTMIHDHWRKSVWSDWNLCDLIWHLHAPIDICTIWSNIPALWSMICAALHCPINDLCCAALSDILRHPTIRCSNLTSTIVHTPTHSIDLTALSIRSNVCAHRRISQDIVLHSCSLVYSIDFLLRFSPFHVPFYCSMLSPFVLLGFSALAYIYPCTLHHSKKKKTSFPPCFAPCLHSCFISVWPAHLGAPSLPSPITSLLLRTQLAPFTHSHMHTVSTIVFVLF